MHAEALCPLSIAECAVRRERKRRVRVGLGFRPFECAGAWATDAQCLLYLVQGGGVEGTEVTARQRVEVLGYQGGTRQGDTELVRRLQHDP